MAKDISWPLKTGFSIGEKGYYDADFGNWTGFYDWLRGADGQILGVRHWLREDTEFLVGYTQNFDYVLTEPSRYIEIYFLNERNVDAKRSSDQEFLYSAIFRSSDGNYAVGFGSEEVHESDLQNLTKKGASWAVAQPLP